MLPLWLMLLGQRLPWQRAAGLSLLVNIPLTVYLFFYGIGAAANSMM
jgi:hypothetical protein